MKKWIKPLIALLILSGVIFLARYFQFDQKLIEVKDWISEQGVWAPVLFVCLYVVATIAALPGSVLTIAAGALFGSVLGVTTVIIGATIGASLSFLIARYAARDMILGLLSKNERFQKLNQLTEKNGDIIVAITRLVPIFPFNLLNYGFGLTAVPFKTYVFWSALCMLPGTILFVVGTDAATQTINNGEIPWVLVLTVLIVIGIISFIVKKAKSRLKE